MDTKLKFGRVKSVSLLCGWLILLVACGKKDVARVHSSELKTSLERIVNSGQLLDSVLLKQNQYVFYFEKDTLRVAAQKIAQVTKRPEKWMVSLTLQGGQQMDLPYKGGALDFIVKSVKLNPSGFNPLAALVDVRLPTYGRIRVTVEGKDGKKGAAITHLCTASTPAQSVPVLGLYPSFANKVKLTYTDMEGTPRAETELTIQTDPLPVSDFPVIKVVKSEFDKMEPGVNLVNYPGPSMVGLSMPYMVDRQGDIRWILLWQGSGELGNAAISLGLQRTKAGTFIAGDQNGNQIIEFDMFGNLIHKWALGKLGYTFHHDIVEQADGNFLITVNKTGAVLSDGQPRVQDHIIELNRSDGSLMHAWDLADMVDTSRYLNRDSSQPDFVAQTPTNWAHNNSVIPFSNYILTTVRYQGIIGYARSGQLRWILSPHKYWKEAYQPFLLAPIDESGSLVTDKDVINGDKAAKGFDWPWGPHTPVALSDNRFLVFDNGYFRHWISNVTSAGRNYSRVVEYKVDIDKKTVQQLWSYGENRGETCFSQALSSVQYLPGKGNVLFCPAMGATTSSGLGGRIVEINPQTKEVVFEMEITASSSTAFNRVTRMPLYPDSL